MIVRMGLLSGIFRAFCSFNFGGLAAVTLYNPSENPWVAACGARVLVVPVANGCPVACLLYTSPSPRD